MKTNRAEMWFFVLFVAGVLAAGIAIASISPLYPVDPDSKIILWLVKITDKFEYKAQPYFTADAIANGSTWGFKINFPAKYFDKYSRKASVGDCFLLRQKGFIRGGTWYLWLAPLRIIKAKR